MDEAACQSALDGGKTLEGNGLRIYLHDNNLVVQDLLEGEYARLPTYILRKFVSHQEKRRAIQGKRAAIERSALISELVADWVMGLPKDASIPIGALAAELLLGNEAHPQDVSSLIPKLQTCIEQTPWYKPDGATVRGVLKVTTALALMGGDASWEDLRSELRQRGFSDNEASEAMAIACTKGRVRRVKAFPFDRYMIDIPKPFDLNAAVRRPRIPKI